MKPMPTDLYDQLRWCAESGRPTAALVCEEPGTIFTFSTLLPVDAELRELLSGARGVAAFVTGVGERMDQLRRQMG